VCLGGVAITWWTSWHVICSDARHSPNCCFASAVVLRWGQRHCLRSWTVANRDAWATLCGLLGALMYSCVRGVGAPECSMSAEQWLRFTQQNSTGRLCVWDLHCLLPMPGQMEVPIFEFSTLLVYDRACTEFFCSRQFLSLVLYAACTVWGNVRCCSCRAQILCSGLLLLPLRSLFSQSSVCGDGDGRAKLRNWTPGACTLSRVSDISQPQSQLMPFAHMLCHLSLGLAYS